MTGKRIDKERADTYAKVRGLGNFKAEDFEATEDGVHNLLSQKTGTTKAELKHVIWNRVVPEVLPDVTTERMYHIRISWEAFGEDNRIVLQILKAS